VIVTIFLSRFERAPVNDSHSAAMLKNSRRVPLFISPMRARLSDCFRDGAAAVICEPMSFGSADAEIRELRGLS